MSTSSRQPARRDPTSQPTTTFFPELAPELAAVRNEALRAMAVDWENGHRAPAEQWLSRYPELIRDEQAAVQIVYEEICLREERGELVRSSEIHRRFPQWKAALQLLFDCHHLIQTDKAVANFPEEGERLGDFQLVRKLGQGAAGRVFLATQPSLSDRPLVVKLTPRRGGEHLSLARLQHTHIVPLYLVQDFPQQKLRAICMPYLGGVSWSWILDALADQPPARRSGRRIVESLELAQSRLPLEPHRFGPALNFLARSSYVQAICWIGACLADALQYAHQRGLVHLDVKPSNVLMGGDGQPMLLDFHLAREIIPAESDSLDHLGGTRNYMSPEQQAAAAALREGESNPQSIDGRSDIYSLGVLLYESLASCLPVADEVQSRATLRQNNPMVGQGLEDILHKCLARQPDDRYANATQLATDLRCSLADLPLQGVPNRSPVERWRKWRRRKPHALGFATAATAVLLIASVSAVAFQRERVNAAHMALNLSEQSISKGDFSTAVEQLENGGAAIRWVPGQSDLRRNLQLQLSAAKRGRLAAAVHKLVEQLRFFEGSDAAQTAQLQQLDAACGALWNARDKISALGALTPGAPGQPALCSDLTDLAISWAALRSRLGGSSPGVLRRDALRVLDEAQDLCGKSLAIELARKEYLSEPAIGGTSEISPRAGVAHDHYAMGRHLFRLHDFIGAREEFERAIELEPGSFWSHFYLTLCAYRLKDYERAMLPATVCVSLSPNSAPCFYNRAMCFQGVGQVERAIHDLNHALQLEPNMAIAWLRRGILQADVKQYSAAMSDYGQALAHGANPAAVHYEMAVVHLARGEADAALEEVNRALQHDPDYLPAQTVKAKLQARP